MPIKGTKEFYGSNLILKIGSYCGTFVGVWNSGGGEWKSNCGVRNSDDGRAMPYVKVVQPYRLNMENVLILTSPERAHYFSTGQRPV